MIDYLGLHIPKCAGTTLRILLEVAFGKEAVRIVNAPMNSHPTPRAASKVALHDKPPEETPLKMMERGFQRWESDILTWNVLSDLGKDTRVVVGHYILERYKDEFKQAKRFTFLRHPISRLLSIYYYALSSDSAWYRDQQGPLVSFMDFCRIPEARNQMTRLFCRGMKMEDFDFIGLTEKLPEHVKALGEHLEIPFPTGFGFYPIKEGKPDGSFEIAKMQLPTMRPTPRPEYIGAGLHRREIEELTFLNAEDMAFYLEVVRQENGLWKKS